MFKKIKSKKRDFGPFSLDPYPPTINRDILIWDVFYFLDTNIFSSIGVGGALGAPQAPP